MVEETKTKERNEKGHDCNNCDKIPSSIDITMSTDGREYYGVLNLNNALFCYKFTIPKDIGRPHTPKEIEDGTKFYFADSDGRPLSLAREMDSYMRNLVSKAAVVIAVQAKQSGVTEIGRRLETILGPNSPAPEINSQYSGCAPATPEIKKFIQDYKSRGQKA
jgi:hypothetical protein